MTTVQESAAAASFPDLPISTGDTLRSALATVLNAIDGGTRTAQSIENEPVSERQVYFALVYAKAKEINPTLGAELLKEVPRLRQALREKKAGNPLPKAIEAVLKRARREKQLASSQVHDLKSYALGRAQLDATQGHLAGRRVRLINQFDERSTSSPMEALIGKVAGNPIATRGELRSLNADLQAGPTIRLKRGSDSIAAAPSTPTTPTPGTTTTPPVNPEEFEWLPTEALTSGVLICLPRKMTAEARFVELRDLENRVLGVAHREPDDEYGRGRWRCTFNGGQSIPEGKLIVSVGRESDTFGFIVPDPRQRYGDIV